LCYDLLRTLPIGRYAAEAFPNMNVRVLLFAALREAAGSRELRVELADGADVAALRTALSDVCPSLRPYLENVAVAINEEYADGSRRLQPGDVAALIPPVSGG
jgi:molybdopterin converting factor subunit 1